MAYKFQLGAAVLSGSLIQEGDIEGTSVATTTGNISSGANLSASANLLVGGTVRLDGVADTAIDVNADSLYFLDGDNLMKKERLSDYATAIAGDGLAASSGILSVGVDDTGIEINSDALRLKDNGVTLAKMAGLTRGSFIIGDSSGDPSALALGSNAQILISDGSDLAYASVSGDIAITNAGAVTIQDGAVESSMLNDNIISGQDALGGATVAQADLLMIDDGPGTVKKVTFSNFEDSIFGNISGDATVAAGGALTIANNAVEPAMLNSSVAGDGLAGGGGSALSVQVSGALKVASDKVGITGSIAGLGLLAAGGADSIDAIDFAPTLLSAGAIADGDSLIFMDADDSALPKKEAVADLAALFAGAGMAASNSVISVANATNGGLAINANDMQLDLSNLAAAAVDLTADSMAIIDGGDSDKSKKESLADLVAAMAGAGLTQNASTKKLEVQSSAVSASANGRTLVEGVNYFADITSDASVNLPASPSAGDKVTVKAAAFNGSAKKITINRQGSHTIDGSNTSIELESDYGAISFVYVAANDWRII